MTRLFYTILYSAIAALAIAQWKRHDSGELLDLVGARRANAQSPDPALPGAFDPAASGGMNNPNGFNNLNPANPATQLMNSNSQQSPTGQLFPKEGPRPASWPSTQAVYWGTPAKQSAQPVPGADGLPGVSLTQYQEATSPTGPAAAAPVDPNVPLGLQYPNPNPPYPTTSNYSNPAAPPPRYPTTAALSAPPYAGPPAGNPTTANAPPYAGPPAGNPTTANAPPYAGAPAGYPPPANAPPGYAPAGYPPPPNAPPTSAPVGSAAPGNVPPGNSSPGSVPPGNSPPTAAVDKPPAAPIDYGKPLPGTRIIARVGTEFILEGDLIGPVNDLINRNKDKIPKEQVEKVREELTKQRLEQLLQTKIVLCDCRSKVPAEGFKKFSEKLGQNFDEVEVPKAMQKDGAKSCFELDEKMREFGGSLDREKAAYVERQMAMGWIHEQSKSDKEVTHEQMLDYYRKHIKEYEFQSKVRWEQLQVRFKTAPAKANAAAMAPLEWDPKTGQARLKADPSKMAAWRTIAEAGNRIIAGEPFAEVAKAVSDGPTASKGGMHDWTTQGSLASDEVDRILFTHPVGQLSQIIEDDRGFQIVRVVERKMAGRVPFTEVQQEIKKRIKDERNAEAMRKYVAGLQNRVSIWTIYDGKPMEELEPVRSKDEPPDARQAGSAPAGTQAPWMRAGKLANP